MKKNIKNLDELFSFASEFMVSLEKKRFAQIVTLEGDLGAGKTALVKKIADFFEIDEELTSPTFVIQKEYEIKNHTFLKKMIHIDAYRLERAADLEYLGWNENINNSENIIFIEWPSQVEGLPMPEKISLSINILKDKSREVNICR